MEKRKPGRPPGAKNKGVVNQTKMLQEAIAETVSWKEAIEIMWEEFLSDYTNTEQKLKILQYFTNHSTLKPEIMLTVKEDGDGNDVIDKEALSLLMNK